MGNWIYSRACSHAWSWLENNKNRVIVHAQYFWYPPSFLEANVFTSYTGASNEWGEDGTAKSLPAYHGRFSYLPLHRPCISAWDVVWIEGSSSQCLQQTPSSLSRYVVCPQVTCQSPCYWDVDNWLPHRNSHSVQFPITVQLSLCQVLLNHSTVWWL